MDGDKTNCSEEGLRLTIERALDEMRERKFDVLTGFAFDFLQRNVDFVAQYAAWKGINYFDLKSMITSITLEFAGDISKEISNDISAVLDYAFQTALEGKYEASRVDVIAELMLNKATVIDYIEEHGLGAYEVCKAIDLKPRAFKEQVKGHILEYKPAVVWEGGIEETPYGRRQDDIQDQQNCVMLGDDCGEPEFPDFKSDTLGLKAWQNDQFGTTEPPYESMQEHGGQVIPLPVEEFAERLDEVPVATDRTING